MSRLFYAAILALPFTPASANDIFGRPEYGPLTLLRSIGYHDHVRQDGTVTVSTHTFPRREGEGFASRMAIYRAAELAQRQGHRYLQILRSEALIGTGMMNRGQEDVSLIVRFADNASPPSECLQRKRALDPCRTVDGAALMGRFAAEMGQPAPDLPSDLRAVQTNPAQYRERKITVRVESDIPRPAAPAKPVPPAAAPSRVKKFYPADDTIQTPL